MTEVDEPCVWIRSRKEGAAELQAMEEQLAAEFVVEFRERFGEELLQKLERYNQAQPLRRFTEQLGNMLFYTEVPLTASQAQQLVGLRAKHYRGSAEVLEMKALDLRSVLAQAEAQALLRPRQLAELRSIAERFARGDVGIPQVRVGG